MPIAFQDQVAPGEVGVLEEHLVDDRVMVVGRRGLEGLAAAVAREAGAVGARLTGAGFGGCTVNLVPDEDVEGFCEQVHQRYHGEYLADRGLDCNGEAVFVARASAAAGSLE